MIDVALDLRAWCILGAVIVAGALVVAVFLRAWLSRAAADYRDAMRQAVADAPAEAHVTASLTWWCATCREPVTIRGIDAVVTHGHRVTCPQCATTIYIYTPAEEIPPEIAEKAAKLSAYLSKE